jgi:hypothetical protein
VWAGLPALIGLISFRSEQVSGTGLMKRNVLVLFGAAVLLTATVALTLSLAMPSANGIGTLKCYGILGTIEKSCDQPPLPIIGAQHARSD